MTNLLAKAVEAHLRALETTAQATVTYSRIVPGDPPVTETLPLVIVIGGNAEEDIDATGVVFNVNKREWLLAVSRLPFLPERGHWIDYDGERWEVMGSTDNGAPFTYADQFKRIYRIRTERVERVPDS